MYSVILISKYNYFFEKQLMFSLQNILPAVLGFTIGLIWIVHKLYWLEWIKFNDKYGIVIPVFVTITLPFIFTYISLNFNLIKELAQLGIFFTIAIAFLNYASNQKTKRDEEITKQAILALERAYEILTDNGKNTAPPRKDRLNWLTTARMLLRYGELKGKLDPLKTNSIKSYLNNFLSSDNSRLLPDGLIDSLNKYPNK
jgi:hypothetical protein